MVAITVILAAVIGAFVLGLGDDLGSGTGSQASISYEMDVDGSDNVAIVISHNGGDALPADAEFVGDLTGTDNSVPVTLSGEFTAGDTVVLAEETYSGTYTTAGVSNFGGTGSSFTNGGTVSLVVDDSVIISMDIPSASI